MTKEEKLQLLEEMDSSLAQFGVKTGRRILAEDLSALCFRRAKTKALFVPETTVKQEIEISRAAIESLRTYIYNKYKENRYILALHKLIFNGDGEALIRRLKFIALTLIQNKVAQDRYQTCDLELLMHRIISTLLLQYQTPNGTSLFMLLAALNTSNRKCSTIDHGYCRLLTTLLSYSTVEEREQALRITTKNCGKTALHMASCIGEVCQVRAILSAGVNPNLFDYSGRVPLQYAVERKCIEMQKIFTWYGSDLTLCLRDATNQTKTEKTTSFLNSSSSFLNLRLDSLQNIFTNYVKNILADFVPTHEVIEPISALHSVRYYYVEHIGKKISQMSASLALKVNKVGPNIKLYAFLMPIYYHEQDQNAVYHNNAHIFPVEFPNHTVIDQTLTLANGNDLESSSYKRPMFRKLPTLPPTRIRAYELPADIEVKKEAFYTLFFNINSDRPFPEFSRECAKYPIIQIMAFAVRNVSSFLPAAQKIDVGLIKPLSAKTHIAATAKILENKTKLD